MLETSPSWKGPNLLMMISSISAKYAEALVGVATDLQQEDKVHDELVVFGELLESHEELQETVTNPAIPFSAKRKIIEELADRVPLGQTVVNLILVLLENARMHQFQQVLVTYRNLLDEQRGLVVVDAFSAKEIKVSDRQNLEKTIANLTGKKVRLRYHIDEKLIGGLRLQIGSTILDGSVETQLNQVRQHLTP